ncbi:hypothetical protein NOR_05950 [Metarhizium rileyi]|uniref:DUF4048 domain-containing protein n=1 Tax=Metarhizium rileyi (strain RCEF 4871) TaxID=1649241 RepID=A0A167BEJ1_METRR|nr:hypothetical protein NOR_05950 [Metarhizium rileyi RCEF 4871]
MTAFLVTICVLDRCLALFDEHRHLSQRRLRLSLAFAPRAGPVRRRRAVVAASTPFSAQNQRRRPHARRHCSRHSLYIFNLAERHLVMASHSDIRRRSSVADRTPIESSILGNAICATTASILALAAPEPAAAAAASSQSSTSTTTTTATTATAMTTTKINTPGPPLSGKHKMNKHRSLDCSVMPPPPLPVDNVAQSPLSKRHSTADSSSRIPNRLSLTLPIALPTSDPSRPTPTATASTPSSIPPTLQDHSALPSPSNVNDFIIAIATKERRVMELREVLAREESELAALKKQFSSADAFRKSDTGLSDSTSRPFTPAADGCLPSPRQSIELDRRSLLLQNQGTPTQSRRTAFRGRHARTLSLLSPARSDSEFSVLEDRNGGDVGPLSIDQRSAQAVDSRLAKRASWQARTQQSAGVGSQLVQDFKLGIRAFVEDIRQITIGDEPINGQAQSPVPSHDLTVSGSMSHAGPTHPSWSRNSQIAQRTTSPLVASPSVPAPPMSLSNPKDVSLDKLRPMKGKHFSWTPLSFESMDDTDWANWESSPTAKSTRWSGSTVHSGAMDDIQSIPEHEEHTTPLKTKNLETPILSPNKLEEILPNVVNSLSPSNIKRTANHLLNEWEKSLAPATPAAQQANKENTPATATPYIATGSELSGTSSTLVSLYSA